MELVPLLAEEFAALVVEELVVAVEALVDCPDNAFSRAARSAASVLLMDVEDVLLPDEPLVDEVDPVLVVLEPLLEEPVPFTRSETS